MVSLVSEFKKTIKNDHILDPKTKFLIAVSGGLDSMCLLSLLGELDLNSKNVFVVYVDHQQRQESVIEENAVRDQAQLQGYNFLSQKIFVQELNNLSETQLRNLRYNSLEAIAAELKIGLVLTAHHLDDQAETFLMQIFRSGTVMGVKGIDRFSQRNGLSFYRPLINISKKQLLLYAQEKKYFFSKTKRI
ncbi:tRNA lysidine(34) synthetase TilS [Xylocopilactobacillus apicola]|uniref:tRNA(Ile)-lysidine synthetase n=1 Tax=Xylocopilactobacillus apicola TaxID=2932184 RepID=A0AAU9DEL6_9LACO|nr:tRNA lysidine(34) synthetase TilS [Xylocopilactobacillus apicola]BDR58335.1 hypothetical protein XA3_07760 [Xylocopilactobacillus apicola]